VRGEVGGLTIVDDFGHHPPKVRCDPRRAKSSFGGAGSSRRFSRIAHPHGANQWHEFPRAFHDADKVRDLPTSSPSGENRSMASRANSS